MYTNFLFPTVYRPTRINSSSATQIDNIFINDPSSISSALLCTEISDHLPIFCFFKCCDKIVLNDKTPFVLEKNKINFNKLNESLTKISWDFVSLHSIIDNDYNELINLIGNAIYCHSYKIKYTKKSIKKQP